MPETKHTPGPWFVFGNGHCVGGPYLEDPEQPTAGVAMCGMRLRDPEEAAANANLIAAAPDLLAAAEEVYDGLVARIQSACPTSVPVFKGIADLHAAIAKAKGSS